jgi:hypothetical protein
MYRYLITQNSQHKDLYRHFFLDPGPSLVVADEGHILKTKDVSELYVCHFNTFYERGMSYNYDANFVDKTE